MSISVGIDSQKSNAADAPRTVTGHIRDHLTTAVASVGKWTSTFPNDARARLAEPALQREIARLSFIDGYHRIRQTTPLILAAIATLDQRQDHDRARCWVKHLDEEYGHDTSMRRDIVAMLGDEIRTVQMLAQTSITPPSAALIGFFEWQVRNNNPHLLILLRLFFETFMAELPEESAAAIHELVPGGSEVVRLHREEDQNHVGGCYDYLDRNFTEHDLPTLIWTLDFIALCLTEAQSWIAAQALGRKSPQGRNA